MSDNNFEYPVRDVNQLLEQSRYHPDPGRDWHIYPSLFRLQDFPPGYWKGKLVLDVGSGQKVRDPNEAFPGATVYAVDPEYGHRIRYHTAHEIRRGVVQALPYRDSIFDFVASSHAVPQHIFPVYKPMALLEMLRVMKPTGEIRLTPCTKGWPGADVSPEVEEILKREGFELDLLPNSPNLSLVHIRCRSFMKDTSRGGELKAIAWNNVRKKLFPK